MPQTQPLVDIVIVNWNAGDRLRACTRSLAETGHERTQVIVVDNASTDGSAEGLDSGTLTVGVEHNKTNRGFGAACNQGAARGSSPYILFLNPDTRVQDGAIATCVAFFEQAGNEDVGVVGARIVDENGETLRTTARDLDIPFLIRHALGIDRFVGGSLFQTGWDHLDTRAVPQVMGAFLMIRRSLFERLGGFDERFFLYFEDVDLCDRVRAAGFQVMHLAEAVIRHDAGGSSGSVKDRRLAYYLASQAIYTAKRYGRTPAAAVLGAAFLAQIPARMGKALARRSGADARAVLGGARLLARDIPRIASRIRQGTGGPGVAPPARPGPVAPIPAAQTAPAVGIVVFKPNPDELCRLAASMSRQTHSVCLYLNGPIEPDLRARLAANAPVRFIESPVNLGIGAALNALVDDAATRGDATIVLLDQDSQPGPDLLQRLVGARADLVRDGERVAVVAPRLEAPPGQEGAYKSPRYLRRRLPAPRPGLSRVAFLPTSGSLVDIDAFRAIGPFRADYFIDAIDLEWCFRAEARGFSCWLVEDETMAHTVGSGVVGAARLGVTMPAQADMRMETYIRNSVFGLRLGYVPLGWKAKQVAYLPLQIALTWRARAYAPAYLRRMARAVADGWQGRLGLPSDLRRPDRVSGSLDGDGI